MLIQADARALPLQDGCVQCVVTSPPYFGLRDYGVAGQIGLERTPAAYVAVLVHVFAEVRRVLADDGVCWLNLGDSYAGNANSGGVNQNHGGPAVRVVGLTPKLGKPKDLLGIPWRVAFALQQPQYHGTIPNREDRIWLAAMLDAEGCLFIHKRKAGQHNGQGYYRTNDNYGPGLEIANTSLAVVERVLALVGKGSICSQSPDQNNRRKQTIYRWNLRTTESRAFVQELYPHLIAKQQQARILYGCPSNGERAEAAHAALMSLHRTGESGVDFPPPPSCFTPGWYLRSDIIWSKCNPMPESVTDRPTKSHEYLFLLSKSERYYYDAQAIAEPVSEAMRYETEQGYDGLGLKDYAAAGVQNPSTVKTRIIAGARKKQDAIGNARYTGFNQRWSDQLDMRNDAERQHSRDGDGFPCNGMTRNKRSVWTIPTMPYAGAHFATMPEALVEPCILAGSRLGDLILDPFSGSGTVLAVAERTGRRSVGVDLNPAYHQLAKVRTAQRGLRFEPAVNE